MKTTPSRYVLTVEILIIILFHVVKIKQSEKHSADMAFSANSKNIPSVKPVAGNHSIQYMLVNLVK